MNDQEVVDSNAPSANGDKPQRERKPRGDRRGARDSNTNQAPPPAEQQPQQPQQPQPQPQQPQQVVQPHVDRQRVEESKRLTTLIATQQAELTPDQRRTINKVKTVVPNVAEADIRATLEQHNWDYLRTVDLYTGIVTIFSASADLDFRESQCKLLECCCRKKTKERDPTSS